MAFKSQFLDVAYRLLKSEGRAMSARMLTDLAEEQGMFTDDRHGATPHQTMKSKLSVHIRRYGDHSVFVRTAPGRFYLRSLLGDAEQPFPARRIRPPRARERVLVFPAKELDTITTWQGLRTSWRRSAKAIFSKLKPTYIPRLEVEDDNDYTQILTYVLVRRNKSLLAYRRGTYNRVEKYLRGSYCVGFGGHVVEDDLTLFNSETYGLFDCAARELMEELDLPARDVQQLRRGEGLDIIGIINDDSTDVGRRHLAFVMQYTPIEHPDWDHPERGEKSVTQLQWISADSPRVLLWHFEYWSQLCLREFEPRLTLARPAYRIIKRSPLRPPHILCLIGPVGSGKSLAAEVLREAFGYHEINTGKVLATLLGIKPVPITPRREFQKQAWQFIQRPEAAERFAQRLFETAEAQDSPRILIDGIRQLDTLHSLRRISQRTRVGVLFVQTSADLAYSFYRSREFQNASIQQFLSVRDAEVEREVHALIGEADAVLYNWSGKFHYAETIKAMMGDLGIDEETPHD